MKVSIFLLLSILLSYGVLAEEKSNDQAVNSSDSVSMNQTKLHIYERKLLKRMEDGRYLVQDFYDSGEKLTEPFYINNPLRLIIFNFDNSAKESLMQEETDYYRFYNLYDGEANIHGKLITWYRSGQMRSQEEYDDGIPLNQFDYWYDNGQNAKEIIYSPHGGIHSNMPIEESSFWISGGGFLPRGFIKHYKSWYLNGQIREESVFVDKRRYVIKKWYENGQQKLEYHIDREANKVGFTYTKFWNELGEEDKKAYGDAFNKINRHQRERKILIVTAEGFWVQDFYKNGKKASNIFFTKYEPNENLFHGIHYGEQYKRYYCFDGVIELFDLDGTKTNEITCSKNNQYIKSTINSSTYIPNYKLQEKRLYLRSEFDSKGFPIGPDKAIGISKTWYENGQLFNEFDHDNPEKIE